MARCIVKFPSSYLLVDSEDIKFLLEHLGNYLPVDTVYKYSMTSEQKQHVADYARASSSIEFELLSSETKLDLNRTEQEHRRWIEEAYPKPEDESCDEAE